MKIILLDDNNFINTVYNNEEVEEYLPKDKIVKVDDELGRQLSNDLANYNIKYVDGKFKYFDNGNAELQTIYDEIHEIESWFSFYDMQVAQYHRAQRLGLPYDNRYGTVDELDTQAEIKAQRIAELRNMVS